MVARRGPPGDPGSSTNGPHIPSARATIKALHPSTQPPSPLPYTDSPCEQGEGG